MTYQLEKISNFKYFTSNMKQRHFNKKVSNFQYSPCVAQIKVLKVVQQEQRLLKHFRVMVMFTLLYETVHWDLTEQHKSRTETVEV
jgi:hypothetical protein